MCFVKCLNLYWLYFAVVLNMFCTHVVDHQSRTRIEPRLYESRHALSRANEVRQDNVGKHAPARSFSVEEVFVQLVLEPGHLGLNCDRQLRGGFIERHMNVVL